MGNNRYRTHRHQGDECWGSEGSWVNLGHRALVGHKADSSRTEHTAGAAPAMHKTRSEGGEIERRKEVGIFT